MSARRANSRFRANYAGIGEMLVMPGMVAAMGKRAGKVRDAAEAAAPVGPADDPHAGRYKEGFELEVGIREGKTRRAVGRVRNTAPESLIVEYGNRNTPRHRILGRALDHAKD